MREPNFERMICNCLLMALVLIYILFSCCGCNVQKKAEARVLANYESVKTIRAKTESLFPCVNDTVVSGNHSDTTVEFNDSPKRTQDDGGNINPYDYPVTPMYGDPFFPKSSQKENFHVTKTVTIHDTSFRYIRDQRAENILDDSLRSAQFNLKVSEGEKDGWKQKAQDRFKALFIVIALFVIGLIIKFYSKNIFSGLKGFITGI
jgi:hypothetical protein